MQVHLFQFAKFTNPAMKIAICSTQKCLLLHSNFEDTVNFLDIKYILFALDFRSKEIFYWII